MYLLNLYNLTAKEVLKINNGTLPILSTRYPVMSRIIDKEVILRLKLSSKIESDFFVKNTEFEKINHEPGWDTHVLYRTYKIWFN